MDNVHIRDTDIQLAAREEYLPTIPSSLKIQQFTIAVVMASAAAVGTKKERTKFNPNRGRLWGPSGMG
jgi:hypothetical protein